MGHHASLCTTMSPALVEESCGMGREHIVPSCTKVLYNRVSTRAPQGNNVCLTRCHLGDAVAENPPLS